MKRIRTQSFRGVSFQFMEALPHPDRYFPPLGATTGRRVKQPTIVVRAELRGKRRIEVLVHEAIHACFDRMPERTVQRVGMDISTFLWRLGYRALEGKER